MPLERYADAGSVWHVTMTALDRQRVLTEPALGAALVNSLKTACTTAQASLLVYCLMPDHLHALILIEETDLIAILRNYKTFSTKLWWQHGGTGRLWQRSAYVRGIRQPEYMDELLAYLFHNPVDEGDIEDWLDRGLMGGTLFDEGS